MFINTKLIEIFWNFIIHDILKKNVSEYAYENRHNLPPYISHTVSDLIVKYPDYVNNIYKCVDTGIDFDITADFISMVMEVHGGKSSGFVEAIIQMLNNHPAAIAANVTFNKEMLVSMMHNRMASTQTSGVLEFLLTVLPADISYNDSKGNGDVTLYKDKENQKYIELKGLSRYGLANAPCLSVPNVWSNNTNNTLRRRFIEMLNNTIEKLPENEDLRNYVESFKKENVRVLLGFNNKRRRYSKIEQNHPSYYTLYEVTHLIPQKIYEFVKSDISKEEFVKIVYEQIRLFVQDIFYELIPNITDDIDKKGGVNVCYIDLLYDEYLNTKFNCFDENSYIFNQRQSIDVSAKYEKIVGWHQADEFFCKYCLLFVRTYLEMIDYILIIDIVADTWYVIKKTDSDEEILDKLYFCYPDTNINTANGQKLCLRVLPKRN